MKKTLLQLLCYFVLSIFFVPSLIANSYSESESISEMSSSSFCDDVVIIPGQEEILITGVNAPWHRIQYRRANASTFMDICSDDCFDPLLVTRVPPGQYIIRVEQSNLNGTNYCRLNVPVEVTSAIDFGADVSAIGGVNEIVVRGVTAPINSIEYRLEGTSNFIRVCNNNCGNPQVISDLAEGTYAVRINQSSPGGRNASSVIVAAIVTSPPVDFCADVMVTGGVGRIMVSGANAPWQRIQFRREGTGSFVDLCNDNCTDPQTFTGIPAGRFVVRVEEGNLDGSGFCSVDTRIVVTSSVDFGANVSVIGGVGEISITGVTAPVNSITYRLEGTSNFVTACTNDCGNPQLISGLAAGTYLVRINQSNANGGNASSVSIAAIVTSPTPDFCADVVVMGGVGQITVRGANAPWQRVQFRPAGSGSFVDLCNDNCTDPQTFTGIPAGRFIVRVEEGNLDRSGFCSVDVMVEVTASAPAPIDFGGAVSVVGGVGEISITGVTAPINSIEYRPEGSSNFITACTNDCGNPQVISGLSEGQFIVRINQSSANGSNASSVSIAAIVTSPAPDFCADVVVTGGVGQITVSGANAPWQRVQFRPEGSGTFVDLCNDNCTDPQTFTGIPAGRFVVRVEEGNLDRSGFCSVEVVAIVTDPVDFGANVSVVGGVGEISITGVTAPVNSIEYRLEGSSNFVTACTNDCGNPQLISGLPEGLFVVRVNQSNADGSNASSVSIAAIVTSPVVDFCSDVVVTGGVGQITVSGANAPWQRVQFRPEGSGTFVDLCNDNCSDPQTFTGIPAGRFVVRVEEGNLDRSDFCSAEVVAIVTDPVDFGANVSVVGGVNEISITGVTAPINSIEYRLEGSSTFVTACTNDCGNPQVISGLPQGLFVVRVNQSNADGSNASSVSIAAIVTSAATDFCADVVVRGGAGEITVSGANAPWQRIQIRRDGSSPDSFVDLCNDNCTDPQTFTGIPAGRFIIRVEEGNLDRSNTCSVDIAAIVTAPRDINASAESRARAFTNFNAFAYERSVNLEWVTNTNYKSDYYIIEKSSDGTNFQELDQIKELDQNGATSYFNMVDEQPVEGLNHYRLKQVFLDGTQTLSQERSVAFGIDLNALNTFPNPANDQLFINLKEFAGKKATIMISNQFGGVVTVQEIDELSNELVRIDLSDYINGMYIIRTKIDRQKIISEKFMVNKLY